MNTPALLLWIPRHLSLNLHFLFALELGMHGRLNHLFPFRIHPCGTPPLSPLSFALCLIPPILLLISSSPSSPTSPPSSVRPRRVRTRNTDGTSSASSALDADVEGGAACRSQPSCLPMAFFPLFPLQAHHVLHLATHHVVFINRHHRRHTAGIPTVFRRRIRRLPLPLPCLKRDEARYGRNGHS